LEESKRDRRRKPLEAILVARKKDTQAGVYNVRTKSPARQ
jgi:hypothetical protein